MSRDAVYDAIARRHSNIPQDCLPLDLGIADEPATTPSREGHLSGLPAPEVRPLAETLERELPEVG